MTDYKWTLKRIDGVYILTCFTCDATGVWNQDGKAMLWDNISSPLLHIRKTEMDRELNMTEMEIN